MLLLNKGEEVFVFNKVVLVVVLIVVLVLLLSCPLLGASVPKRRKRRCRQEDLIVLFMLVMWIILIATFKSSWFCEGKLGVANEFVQRFNLYKYFMIIVRIWTNRKQEESSICAHVHFGEKIFRTGFLGRGHLLTVYQRRTTSIARSSKGILNDKNIFVGRVQPELQYCCLANDDCVTMRAGHQVEQAYIMPTFMPPFVHSHKKLTSRGGKDKVFS